LIFSARIFDSNVDAGIPSFTAAPNGPEMRPWVSANAAWISPYTEFLTEASRLVVEALDHCLEHPETLFKLYGILGRIPLVCT
jgi:hypothetical protein